MGLLSKDDLHYYLSQLGAYFAFMLRDNPDDIYKELYSHYDAVREHIQTLEKTNGWISVKDRMPEKREIYMCLCYDFVTKSYWHELLWYENNRWWSRLATLEHDYTKHVVYWMPLPEAPKEET